MARRRLAAAKLGLALLSGLCTSAAIAAGTADPLAPTLLETRVNGAPSGDPILFLKDPGGRLFVSAATLRAWRIAPPPVDPAPFDGDLYYPLDALPGIALAVSEAEQAVAITVDPALFAVQQSSLGGAAAPEMTRPGTGGFVDYDLLLQQEGGSTRFAGALRAGLFMPIGVGESSFIAATGGEGGVTRMETRFTIDRPGDAITIRLGDSIAPGGPGAPPVRFAGVQYRRNFALQPGFITMPLPVGSGSAAVPSVVDIYVNNALAASQPVAPGPFQIANIPVQAGGGAVQIVVRDPLGRETLSSQPYYASTLMLRRGLHDFTWQAGFLREDFGRRSNGYGAFFVSTAHRYGLTDALTGEGFVEGGADRQAGGAGLTLLLASVGQLSASASISRSDGGWGRRVSAGFERRTRGLSFALSGEAISAEYRTLGGSEAAAPPRYTVQSYVDLPVWRGAFGASFVHRALRDGPSESVAGLSASVPLGGASLQLYARRAVAGRSNTLFGANLALAFGGRRSGSAGIEHDRRGSSAYATVQEDLPAGPGDGWRIAAAAGRTERAEAGYFRNLPMATLGAEIAHANGNTGLRLSAVGSLAFVGGRPFASRRLGESFAVVDLPGFAHVRVYADEQLVGATDGRGALLVPDLRPFEANSLRLDVADLPIEADVASIEQSVRPYAGAGSVVRFDVRASRGALVGLVDSDGRPLPAGAVARAEDGSEHVVVTGGELWLANLSAPTRLRVEHAGGACIALAVPPPGDDPQPRLRNLPCRPEPVRHASR